MEVCVSVEPQLGATYEQILTAAQVAEQLGFHGFFRSDHLLAHSDDGAETDSSGPSDAWITLAGIARETTRIRLGTLVSPVTFRAPGLLAVQVANVDAMSKGRVELGIGAGWYDREHLAYGIPFPTHRFDLLDESLAVITGLWSASPSDPFDFTGKHFHVASSPGVRVSQKRLPIIVGGLGRDRTPTIAATYATEFNLLTRDSIDERIRKVEVTAESIGRDPRSIRRSVTTAFLTGKSRDDLARRLSREGNHRRYLDPMRATVGTVDEVRQQLDALRICPIDRVYLQLWDLHDIEHLELIGRELLP